MQYLCLVYFEPTIFDRMSQEEKVALDRDSLDYDEALERRGVFFGANALQSSKRAITVRVRSGAISATDGPFAETKEELGGYILIEAKDMDEAKGIAAGIPLAKYGSIEVRPVMTIERAE